MVPLLWGLLLAAAGPMLSASFEMRPKEDVTTKEEVWIIFIQQNMDERSLKLSLPSLLLGEIFVSVNWFMYLANTAPAKKFAQKNISTAVLFFEKGAQHCDLQLHEDKSSSMLRSDPRAWIGPQHGSGGRRCGRCQCGAALAPS